MAADAPPRLPWVHERKWEKDSVATVLELAYRQMDRQAKQSDRLNSKGSWFVGVAGSALALGLGLFASVFKGPPPLALGGVTISAVFLLLAFLAALRALDIRTAHLAPYFWDVLHEEADRDNLRVQHRILNGLVDEYETTEAHNAERARFLRVATWCLTAGIALFGATVLITLIFRPPA